jgi:serine/threonine-protein kinase RsbW
MGLDSATVELKIPSHAEFIGVARMMIMGVASRTSFSYDEVEDLRLAVGEACTSAIDRATKAKSPESQITIACRIEPSRLAITVSDPLPFDPNEPATPPPTTDGLEEQGIGALLMEILVDEIHVDSSPEGGTVVSMVKYIGR